MSAPWKTVLALGALLLAFPPSALATAPSNADLHFRAAGLSPGTGVVTVPMRLSWTAGRSDLGFSCCSYHVDEEVHPGFYHAVTSRHFVNLRLPINDDLNHDPCCFGFTVTGFDSAGNNVGTTQTPDNSQTPEGSQESAAAYAGKWVSGTKGQFWHGASVTSKASGATAMVNTKFGFNVCGESVAWVSTTGPTHGSAKIYINGIYDTTVSTHAKTIHYRQVVWSKTVSSTANENTCPVIKIVNLASAGHPKVSVDGFLALNDD